MNRLFLLALAALSLTAPALAQINSLQDASQAPESPYTRLILAAGNTTRQYELLKFTNVKDACNFFGASERGCNLAEEYFAGWGGSYTATLEFDPCLSVCLTTA